MMPFEEKEAKIVEGIRAKRDQISRPRVGDFVVFPTGEIERLVHDHGENFQTAPDGSFYMTVYGASHSGGLNPSTPAREMVKTAAVMDGEFWIFKAGIAGAGRGVYFKSPCRVYVTTAKYEGFMNSPRYVKDYPAVQKELVERHGLSVAA